MRALMQAMTREHTDAEDGLDCWCAPLYYLPCLGCDGGCPLCDFKGSTPLTRAEAEAADRPIIVAHHL
jgi:hypothetical protein